MITNAPVLIVLIPLATALLTPLISYLVPKLMRYLAPLALGTVTLLSGYNLYHVVNHGAWHYHFGGWTPPFGIEFVIDPLSATIAVVVGLVATLVIIFAKSYLPEERENLLKFSLFYVLFLLVATGIFGITLAGDIFTLYVFIEIASIAAYGLLAMGGYKAAVSSFRYVLIGTVGASFYLLAVAFIYANTGSLNMADLSTLLPPLLTDRTMIFAVAILVAGLGIKSALWPMHTWMPDVYTYGPPPAVAFIAGTMTKVFSYVLFRFLYFILGGPGNPVIDTVLFIIGILAAIAILYGSIMAIAQKDFRRMLAYSSVAQISYLPLAMAIGSPAALVGLILQLISHAMTKSLLYMTAGGIDWKTGNVNVTRFNGLYKIMPITCGVFLVAACSMIGLPPTSGFFAKWYLLTGSLSGHQLLFAIVLVISSLLNAIYFLRLLERFFFRTGIDDKIDIQIVRFSVRELPLSMLVPMITMAILIVIVGLGSGYLVDFALQYISPLILGGGGL